MNQIKNFNPVLDFFDELFTDYFEMLTLLHPTIKKTYDDVLKMSIKTYYPTTEFDWVVMDGD
jgi:hypothetical protein